MTKLTWQISNDLLSLPSGLRCSNRLTILTKLENLNHVDVANQDVFCCALNVLNDPAYDRLRVTSNLAFPYSYNVPSTAPEGLEISLITADVFFDLLAPKRCELPPPAFEPIAMPKISVDKDHEPGCREDNIR